MLQYKIAYNIMDILPTDQVYTVTSYQVTKYVIVIIDSKLSDVGVKEESIQEYFRSDQ